MGLEYPKELYEEHNSYPLAQEKKVMKKELMSDCQKAASDRRPEIGATEQREASADTGGQKIIRDTLQKSAVLSETRVAFYIL